MPPQPKPEPQFFKSGVLNVDKAAGETSFSVVRRLRRLTSAHRVGHAGTLDPLATGVLPVLFESATRLSDYAHRLLSAMRKEFGGHAEKPAAGEEGR